MLRERFPLLWRLASDHACARQAVAEEMTFPPIPRARPEHLPMESWARSTLSTLLCRDVLPKGTPGAAMANVLAMWFDLTEVQWRWAIAYAAREFLRNLDLGSFEHLDERARAREGNGSAADIVETIF